MPTLSANITVIDTITFLGDSINSGKVVAKAAIFKHNSINTGEITADTILFKDASKNYGKVNGQQNYDPPIEAKFGLAKWPGDTAWVWRYLRPVASNRQIGPLQMCPSPNDGCYDDPETYRSLVHFNYVYTPTPD